MQFNLDCLVFKKKVIFISNYVGFLLLLLLLFISSVGQMRKTPVSIWALHIARDTTTNARGQVTATRPRANRDDFSLSLLDLQGGAN